MKHRAIIPLIILIGLMVPLAGAFTVDGPLNFMGPHGGNVRFDSTVTATQYRVLNTLNRFANLRINGNNQGTLAFDAQTGVNMTILGISRYEIRYRVDTLIPGAATTYVYYQLNNDKPPTGTNTNTINYNYGTDVATVTTIGNGVIVTLSYMNVTNQLITGLGIIFDIIPLLLLLTTIRLRQAGLLNNKALLFMLVATAVATVIAALRLLGM